VKKIKPIIGRNDIVDFPLFGLSNVPVKIDSGAYTSTIHCSRIKEEDNQLKVVFLSKKHKSYIGSSFIFSEYSVKKVKSSNGEVQERFKVKGDILVFGKKYKTEFTLSKRSNMNYPVLLGRRLLNKRFLIDTSLSNQSFQIKNKTTE
jgi:hypothetical protein